MSLPIAEFTRRLLTREGALIERDHQELVAVMPTALAAALETAEYQRIAFDPRAAAPGALVVDYGSPIVDRFEAVVEGLGRVAVAPSLRLPLKQIDAEAALNAAVTVTNGIVRDCRAESGHARYVGFFVGHELLADERVSGLTDMWVNTTMRSAPRFTDVMRTVLAEDQDSAPDAGADREGAAEIAVAIASAWSLGAVVARRAVEDRLREAIDSLKRRRDRDFIRLREYYQAIDGEIRRRVSRAQAKGDDTAAKAEATRLEATARAYQGRVMDLVDRYRARVRIRPLGALVLTVRVHVLTARLHRRSASRTVTVAWNPIDRAVEPPCCEACGVGAPAVTLCDERVHLLCSTCARACEACGRFFCRACHARCPRRH